MYPHNAINHVQYYIKMGYYIKKFKQKTHIHGWQWGPVSGYVSVAGFSHAGRYSTGLDAVVAVR